VEAVMAWDFPAAYGFMAAVPDDVDFAKIAAEVVDDAVAEVSDKQVTIRRKVTEGIPAQVLLDASKGADLLVVGSRGHGGFTEALLGSVSQHCVHHATCPVVVIRGSGGSQRLSAATPDEIQDHCQSMDGMKAVCRAAR
jgi:nucleotide-binding universal stress UspA family protein